MKKIAIPTRGNVVDDHFGHCEFYTVITADDDQKKIIKKELLPSPQGCGCKSNIAEVLRQMGVQMMLAGGIGEGAIRVLNAHGIGVIRGCSGEIDRLAEKYLNHELTDSGLSCMHHEHHNGEGHTCNH
jgi:predicted Fe-Mo cluster-binding NifX family protein